MRRGKYVLRKENKAIEYMQHGREVWASGTRGGGGKGRGDQPRASCTDLEEEGSGEQREACFPQAQSALETVSNPGFRKGQRDFLQMDRKTSTLILSLYGP